MPSHAIPPHELDNLSFTCEDAEEAADEGDVSAGYELLAGGLYRAEQLLVEGEPWAADLLEQWQAAAAEYDLRYNRRQGSRTMLPPLPETAPHPHDDAD